MSSENDENKRVSEIVFMCRKDDYKNETTKEIQKLMQSMDSLEQYRGKTLTPEEWDAIWLDELSDSRIGGACAILDDYFTQRWNNSPQAITGAGDSCVPIDKEDGGRPEYVRSIVDGDIDEMSEEFYTADWASYNCDLSELGEREDYYLAKYKELSITGPKGDVCLVSYSRGNEVTLAFVCDSDRYACEWYDWAEGDFCDRVLKEYNITLDD